MEITVKKQIIGKKLLNNYDYIMDSSESLACVKKDGKYGFINKEGEEVIKPVHHWAHDFSEGLARVEKNGRYGFIDKEGKEVIKHEQKY